MYIKKGVLFLINEKIIYFTYVSVSDKKYLVLSMSIEFADTY